MATTSSWRGTAGLSDSKLVITTVIGTRATRVGTGGIGCRRSNCWDAGAGLVVNDEICARLLRDRSSCDGKQHTLICVVEHAEHE